jgi:hypothetical protein
MTPDAIDSAPSTRASHGLGDRLGPACFRMGAIALWAYTCALIPFSWIFKGSSLGSVGALAVFCAGCIVIRSAPRTGVVRRWVSTTRMLELGVASLVLVLMLLAGDLAFAVRDNWARSKSARLFASDARNHDSTVWHGELYPRIYFPAGESFSLYKPNVRVTGETYGERYVAAMRASRTMVDSVLERRHLSYFIGPDGLRELEPLSQSGIFALGDSFVFGFATDEGKIWPDLLGSALREPVYNLGVSATGPKPQLDLLKYMLRTHRDSMRIRQLLWMIFEGNDLENSYADTPPIDRSAAGVSALLHGTVIEPFLSIPERVRNQSVVGRLIRGELTLSSRSRSYGQHQIDGVDLPIPLFHSKQFGYRLFVPADIDAATQPREYVLNHPNRPLLDGTFREMRELSQRLGFTVTVIIAPSDARLYGAAFDGFPPLSTEPHFINYVASVSREMGFSVVNLLPLLQPFAKDELLYYRDDHHWNVRGNAVVAQLIASELAGRSELRDKAGSQRAPIR